MSWSKQSGSQQNTETDKMEQDLDQKEKNDQNEAKSQNLEKDNQNKDLDDKEAKSPILEKENLEKDNLSDDYENYPYPYINVEPFLKFNNDEEYQLEIKENEANLKILLKLFHCENQIQKLLWNDVNSIDLLMMCTHEDLMSINFSLGEALRLDQIIIKLRNGYYPKILEKKQ